MTTNSVVADDGVEIVQQPGMRRNRTFAITYSLPVPTAIVPMVALDDVDNGQRYHILKANVMQRRSFSQAK